MPYMIRTTDKPDAAELRAATRAEHLVYLRRYTSRILAAGGFLNDDGSVGKGGMIILDTETYTNLSFLYASTIISISLSISFSSTVSTTSVIIFL